MFGWRKEKGGGKVRGKYLEESNGFMISNCVFEIVTDIFPCVGTFPYLRPKRHNVTVDPTDVETAAVLRAPYTRSKILTSLMYLFFVS